jgi:HIRAN domain
MDSRRLRRIALFLTALSGAVHGEDRSTSIRLLVQSSPLAGFRFHAGPQVWRELRVGDRVELAREPDNRHDANAVKVLWRGHVLGYVPRRENAALAWGLDRGTPLRARISALAEHPNPARRVRFEVYVE